MSEKINKLKERKRGLLERINHAEAHKKEVIKRVQKLASEFSSGSISYNEYEESIKRIFGERSPEKWIEYYDSYIKECEKLIGECNKEVIKENVKKSALYAAFSLFFVFLFLAFYNLSEKAITGLTIEGDRQSFSENINKDFN